MFTPGTNCPTRPENLEEDSRTHYRHVWPEKHSRNGILEDFFFLHYGSFPGGWNITVYYSYNITVTYKNGNCQ